MGCIVLEAVENRLHIVGHPQVVGILDLLQLLLVDLLAMSVPVGFELVAHFLESLDVFLTLINHQRRELHISSGGEASITTVSSGGLFKVCSKGDTEDTNVESGGTMFIYDDGMAKNVVVNGGVYVIESDGWAYQESKGKLVSSNTIVKNGGTVIVSGGGHCGGVIVSNGGHIIVESDGNLGSAFITSGDVTVKDGVESAGATLLDGGVMVVQSGGSGGCTVSSGGIVKVESGGYLRALTVSTGGVVTGVLHDIYTVFRMYGGTLDLDISNAAPGGEYLIDDDANFDPNEDFNCTLTVDGLQANGTYNLMEYAYGFDTQVITAETPLTVKGTDGSTLGTLTVGKTVYINGVAVGERSLTGEDAPAPGMIELEGRFTVPPTFARYRTQMYGDIIVTDDKGTALSPNRGEDGVVRYVAKADELYSFTVRAPELVTVNVSGAVLTPEEAVKTDEGVLAGLGAYTGGAGYRTLTWTFAGLYTVPEITGEMNGKALTPILNENEELVFYPAQDDALAAQMRATVEQFFNSYVDYTSKAYNATRHHNLLNRILPNTELYSEVQGSRDAMIWASATEVHFDELSFSDFCPVGDNCFTCTIRYKADLAAKSWYRSYTYDLQNAYEMAFVRSGGKWLAAAMNTAAG